MSEAEAVEKLLRITDQNIDLAIRKSIIRSVLRDLKR